MDQEGARGRLSEEFHPAWRREMRILTCRTHLDPPLKDRFTIFQVFETQSGAHMNIKRGLPCCNHSTCSCWPLIDPFIVHFSMVIKCKVCAKIYSEVYLKLVWFFSSLNYINLPKLTPWKTIGRQKQGILYSKTVTTKPMLAVSLKYTIRFAKKKK